MSGRGVEVHVRAAARATAWPLLAALLAGCGGNDAPRDLEPVTASAAIGAAAGGSLALPDGTRVTIPPGALAADTTVTLSRLPPEAFAPGEWLASVRLEPEGTAFATPVEVDIPYDPAAVESPDDVVLVNSSPANDAVPLGGETSRTALEADVDRAPGRVTARVGHFSVFEVLAVPRMFVSPLLPGRYLRGGDLLYALTGGTGDYREASFLPMHVGMFFDNAARDGVIESTEPTTGCNPPASGVVDWQGYAGDCGFPALNGQHLFAGARRPRSATVDQGRTAVSKAREWLGTPYGISGLGIAAVGLGVDCVQLAEIAWKGAGVWITHTPRPFLTPYAQFANAVPVTDIEVRLSEGEVRIPIVVAVRTTDVLSFRLNSYDAAGAGRVDAALTLTADVPDILDAGRARLEDPAQPPRETGRFGKQAVKDLVLRPTAEDADLTHHFHLGVEVPSRGFSTRIDHFLRVHVVDDVSQPPPGLSENACPVGAFCDYCLTPQAGSAWLGELDVSWETAATLGQFSLEGRNPLTGEAIDFTVTFQVDASGRTPLETTFQASRNRILGTYAHDPEWNATCCSRYTGPDGKASDVQAAWIDLSFSGESVEGTLVVRTKEGKDATVEVRGCSCPCT